MDIQDYYDNVCDALKRLGEHRMPTIKQVEHDHAYLTNPDKVARRFADEWGGGARPVVSHRPAGTIA